VILAGGLSDKTVQEAIRRVHPFGVDVSSGVEKAPGRKDISKVRLFVKKAKEVLN
jgi:phosphoribosylanthranilate isomerase